MSEPNDTWQSVLEEAWPDMSAICAAGIPAVTGEPNGGSIDAEPQQLALEDRAPSELKREASAASRKSGSGQSQASRRSAKSNKSTKSVKSTNAEYATTEPPSVVSGSAVPTTASVMNGYPVPHMEAAEQPALDTVVSLERGDSNMSQLSAKSGESKATAKSTGSKASVSSKLSKSSGAKSIGSRLSAKLVAATAVGAGAGMAATATTSPAAANSMNIAKALEEGTDLEDVDLDDARDEKETVDMSDDGSSKKCEEGGGAAALAAVTAALSAVAASMSFHSAGAGSTTAQMDAAVGAEGLSRDIGGENAYVESKGRSTRAPAFLQGMSESKKKAMAIALTVGFLGIMGLSVGLGVSSRESSISMSSYGLDCLEEDRRVLLAERGHGREQHLRREDGDLENLGRRRLIRELISEVVTDGEGVEEDHIAETSGGRMIRQRRLDSKSSKSSKGSKACSKSGKGSKSGKSKQGTSSLSFSMSMSMNMCMSLPSISSAVNTATTSIEAVTSTLAASTTASTTTASDGKIESNNTTSGTDGQTEEPTPKQTKSPTPAPTSDPTPEPTSDRANQSGVQCGDSGLVCFPNTSCVFIPFPAPHVECLADEEK